MGTHISQDCSNSEGALEYLKEGKGKRVLIVTDKRKVRKLELPSRELVADISHPRSQASDANAQTTHR